ncbi:MAG: outer membrane beta-barrel protein, partial [Gemmatimonadaceae bacterium]
MSRNSAVASQSSLTTSTARQALLRAGAGLAALTALTLFASAAHAQGASETRPFELRPVVGALVPTGDQRDLLKDAVLLGAQLSYSLTPNLAVVGSFGWAPSEDRLLADEKVDLFQYDLGVEGRLRNLTPASSISTRPYAAIGVGGRTYSYRDLDDADAQTNFLGYGALGLEVAQASGPFGIRIEARDNITAFKGLRGELAERKARNDVQLT